MMSPAQAPASCHVHVKRVARAIAAAAYEQAAKDNHFYKENPSVEGFVQRNWGLYVGAARETLVKMLSQKDINDHMKDEIVEIIIQDRSLQGLPTGNA